MNCPAFTKFEKTLFLPSKIKIANFQLLKLFTTIHCQLMLHFDNVHILFC